MAHGDEAGLPLLNIYEVEAEGATRHLIGFLDPVLAGARGIDSRSMVGEFTPGPDGEFDPETFEVNPEFLEAVAHYLNEQAARSTELAAGARSIPGERLYIVDPRNQTDTSEDPPPADVLGYFDVRDDGTIEPDSFHYHHDHTWFDPQLGVSGLLSDRLFYDWLNPITPE